MILVSILLITDFGNSRSVIVYDCRMAEWHPDIPIEVKEECRRMLSDELEKQRQQELQRRLIRT